MTEQEMRDFKVPAFDTVDELTEFVRGLVDQPHDQCTRPGAGGEVTASPNLFDGGTRRKVLQKTVMCLIRHDADGALAKHVEIIEDLRSRLAGALADARTVKEERDKLTEALNKGLNEARDEVTRIFADEGKLLRGTINDLRRDLEGSQLALKNCDAARAAFAAELAQLKGKMAADKKVMDELSDAAARGRNLEVT